MRKLPNQGHCYVCRTKSDPVTGEGNQDCLHAKIRSEESRNDGEKQSQGQSCFQGGAAFMWVEQLPVDTKKVYLEGLSFVERTSTHD